LPKENHGRRLRYILPSLFDRTRIAAVCEG